MSDADQIQTAPPDNSIASVPDTPPALDVAPVEPPPASVAAPAGVEAPGDVSSAPGAEALEPEKSGSPTGAGAPAPSETSQPITEPPAADAPLVRATAPTAEELAASTLIEVPVQGAALEREQPIPPADAQPMIDAGQIQADSAALVDAVMAAKGSDAVADAAAIEGHSTESNIIEADEVIEDHSEHPLDTIDRLRAKLAAYGTECLKTVQHEIEYLISLVDDDRPAKP